MAIDSTKLIDLPALNFFAQGLKSKFMNQAACDGRYLKIGGDSSQPFSAKTVNLGDNETVAISFNYDENAVRLQGPFGDGNTADILLRGGGRLLDENDLAEFTDKADKKSVIAKGGSYAFCSTPQLAVFDGIVSADSSVNAGSVVYYDPDGSMGRSTLFTGGSGFYLVISRTNAVFLFAANRYSLYYNTAESALCRFSNGRFVTIGTAQTIIDGDTDGDALIIATDEEIDELLTSVFG